MVPTALAMQELDQKHLPVLPDPFAQWMILINRLVSLTHSKWIGTHRIAHLAVALTLTQPIANTQPIFKIVRLTAKVAYGHGPPLSKRFVKQEGGTQF
jgi:hypothetical protein